MAIYVRGGFVQCGWPFNTGSNHVPDRDISRAHSAYRPSVVLVMPRVPWNAVTAMNASTRRIGNRKGIAETDDVLNFRSFNFGSTVSCLALKVSLKQTYIICQLHCQQGEIWVASELRELICWVGESVEVRTNMLHACKINRHVTTYNSQESCLFLTDYACFCV